MQTIQVTLKGGVVREYPNGVTPAQVAESIGPGLAKAVLGAIAGDRTIGLDTPLTADCALTLLTFDDEAGKDIYRHTTSHILACAVKKLRPEAKLAIGPAIDKGFYYDFDVPSAFTPEDLAAIEAEMEAIVKADLPLTRSILPREEALKLMRERGEPYKVELIEDLPADAELSFYRMGDFIDLCVGPHLPSTGRVKAFKLISAAGAYWKGSEKNKMLQRIYGTSFPKKAELDEHLAALEEAKKRDHNKLGRELEFFTTSDLVGQGLPLIMPKGAKIIQVLQRFVEDEEERRGYVMTKTPMMAKSDLYKVSGHWEHYKDGMFLMGCEGEEGDGTDLLCLRPMTCPHQFLIYNSSLHSYRDLPVRFSETSTLFRNETSGEMHGLIRVRQFTISEGHLIVTPEQLESEVDGVLDLIMFMMKAIGIQDDITYRFSKWDPANREKYIDNPAAWEDTQNKLRSILDRYGIPYVEADGEAAFYGPKLDIQFRNVHGKEDTIITVQVDFAMADRFDMVYVDSDGTKKRPYVIHRTSIGCYERTLAMLIEKYAGAFPTWLAPVQAVILPLTEKHAAYAGKVRAMLAEAGVRCEVDARNEKIGYRIREAQMKKVPYMLVMGDREEEAGEVSVRSRKEADLGTRKTEDFVEMIRREIRDRAL
jgi:threonyl-tRNA synthetase